MIHDKSNFRLTFKKRGAKYHRINVDDDIVGNIVFNGTHFSYNNQLTLRMERKIKKKQISFQKRIAVSYNQFQTTNNCIILLLESPSSDEFAPKRPCPAYGRTGGRINSQFISLINKYLNVCFSRLPPRNTVFSIVIMNSIRYQCDLGIKGNRTIINGTFNNLWNRKNNPFSDDLVERISIIKPVLIINSCTSYKSIKLCSSKFLMSMFPHIKIVDSSSHPSTWNIKTKLY